MSTVTVSIGRNVGNVPLSAGQWDRFRAAVAEGVNFHTSDRYVEDALSFGAWEGVEEESRTWVALLAADYDRVPELTRYLAAIARAYGQDAIAVTTGVTVLAGLVAA